MNRPARSVYRVAACSVFVLASFLAGCAHSGSITGTSAPTPTPTPAAITVTVSGPVATRLLATSPFTAVVANSTNQSVTWQVNGVTGGNTTTGTISTSGLYTAPAALVPPNSVNITAVSAALTTATSTVAEALQNPLPIQTSVVATQVGSSLSYLVDTVGTGFVPTSTLQVNGAAVTTTFVSATELQATVPVKTGTTSVTVATTNTDPGGSTSAAVTVPITFLQTSLTAAARLLDQATFGPTQTDITHVQTVGLNAYLNEQFAAPTTPLAAIPTTPLPALCLANNAAYPCAESEWWQTAITGPDQLRQRVAFALSEMFVVSTQSIPGQAIPPFHNILANDAFGNFQTVMKDVTLSPAMGGYLNMLNSAKPANGQIANENYGRELMQLFTLGLYKLNPDGTVQVDSTGTPVPEYTQAQVQAFARAYTGWTYGNAGGAAVTKFPNAADWTDPMQPYEAQHDVLAKILLNGTTLPANQTAAQDLAGAISNIFNDPNVGPFVCKQLIQHLVTSTPSPAYVARISAVFADNGSGTRGDLKAVVRAILTDTEARAGDTNASFDGGHLREPILFLTAMMRGLNFTNTDPNSSFYSLSGYAAKLNQEPYRAASVFNFFPPDYVIPNSTLNAPEFDIENTATAVLRLSLADSIVNNKIGSFTVDLSATSALGLTAANPANLVDTLSTLFMHGQMPTDMRSVILNAITPLTNNAQRVRVALYLVVTSSQYKIIH